MVPFDEDPTAVVPGPRDLDHLCALCVLTTVPQSKSANFLRTIDLQTLPLGASAVAAAGL